MLKASKVALTTTQSGVVRSANFKNTFKYETKLQNYKLRNVRFYQTQQRTNITKTFHTSPFQSSKIATRGFADLPPHTVVGLPALSPTMETGNLAKWRKKEGDVIKAGEIIAEVETDKATVDFEATEDGYLAKILIAEGTKDLPVGTPIAITVEDKGALGAFANYKAGAAPKPAAPAAPAAAEKPVEKPVEKPAAPAPAAAAPAAPAPQPTHNVVPGAPPPPSANPRLSTLASPLAKAAAAQRGIDVGSVKGTGPNGRVIFADVAEAQVSQAAAAAPTQGAFEDIPNSNIRKVTAQRLTLSKQTIPHYYLTVECNVDSLLKLRTTLNDKANGAYKLSVNDFVVKAAALALRKVPAVNSSWTDNAIRKFNYVDINVAVNTDKGLFTPIVKDADKIGLSSIANTVKDLAEKAKANKLQPHEFQGGTFTISNLGMFGIKTFAAVINPPQACILAVGGTDKRVVIDEAAKDSSNPYKVANYMSVTLSCDHRVVDGAIGAEWLKSFREYIEDPVKMLL